MSLKRQIYLLDPKKIKQETIAVTFAKTSRSPLSFKEIAEELSDEKSSEFHEKWVVGYGHSSVAEHATLHIAVENISRLAVETLESNRLASYTEKSSRYQKWDQNAFYTPEEIENSEYKDDYINTLNSLFDFYHRSIPIIRTLLEKKYPQENGSSEANWNRKIQSRCIDVCRFILPSASLANVGVTINARELEHALKKMLSHPLSEVKNIGKEIKGISQREIPTLVKYADEIPYLVNKQTDLSEYVIKRTNTNETRNSDWCNLINYDPHSENKILAAVLYRYGKQDFQQILNKIAAFSHEEKENLFDIIFRDLSPYDTPLRELEYSSYAFDITLDQGAYFELKRHRMMSQTTQSLACECGYAIPKLFSEANLLDEYVDKMEHVIKISSKIRSFDPNIASYLIPNAFNRKVLISSNYRSLYHFVNLRTKPSAHFSIRRIAQKIAEEIQNATPYLGKYLPISPGETYQDIENEFFYQT